MTNREILKRLQALEADERDVASSMDMPQEQTANWGYAETAAIARSCILQQGDEIATLRSDLTAARLERDEQRRLAERLNVRVWALAVLLYPRVLREALAGDIGWPE